MKKVFAVLFALVLVALLGACKLIVPDRSDNSSTSAYSSESNKSSGSGSGSAVSDIRDFSLTDTSEEADSYRDSMDYLLGCIDTSKYSYDNENRNLLSNDEMSSDKSYIKSTGSIPSYKTYLALKNIPSYDFGKKFSMEGIEYTANQTTLRDVLNDGWKYYTEESKPEANKNIPQSVSLTKNGVRAYVGIGACGNDPESETLNSFSVKGINVNASASEDDFEFNGFAPGDSLETAVRIFGNPSRIFVYAGKSYSSFNIDYEETGNTKYSLSIEFTVNTDEKTSKAKGISFRCAQ